MTRYATIDVGSNSVLLLIADHEEQSLQILVEKAELTRLGEGLEQTGKLSDLAVQRTIDALKMFVCIAADHEVQELAAVGTEALRVAVNGTELIDRVAREVGIPIQVIGGEEEARLSYLAVREGLGLGEVATAVFDVGGGSTELILGQRGGMSSRCSLKLGGLTLTERFLHSDPVDTDEVERLARHLQSVLESAPRESQGDVAYRLVGIGGALTTLSAVSQSLEPYDADKVHGADLPLEEVERQVNLYRRLTVAERREIKGLHPKRADTILAGAMVAVAVMGSFGAETVTISDRGLRHGLMADRFGV